MVDSGRPKITVEDLDNLNFSLNELLNNDDIVNEYIAEKHKDFNYQDFIFDTLPNYTTYEVDSTTNIFNNVNFEQLENIFENVVNKCTFTNTVDEYSYYLNYPLQALSFEEQFNSEESDLKLFNKENTVDDVINYIGTPLEFNFTDDKNFLKIDSSKRLINNLEKNKTVDKNELWDLSNYTLVDNSNQLNPDKIDEFIEFCFSDNTITKKSIKLSILGLILNNKNKTVLKKMAENQMLLERLGKWLKKEKKNPTSLLTFIIEVLNYLPLEISTIKATKIGKLIKDIPSYKKIDDDTKKLTSNLVYKWRKLLHLETLSNKSDTMNKNTKPLVINVVNDNENNNKKTNLLDTILSAKKSPLTSSSASTSKLSENNSNQNNSSTSINDENNDKTSKEDKNKSNNSGDNNSNNNKNNDDVIIENINMNNNNKQDSQVEKPSKKTLSDLININNNNKQDSQVEKSSKKTLSDLINQSSKTAFKRTSSILNDNFPSKKLKTSSNSDLNKINSSAFVDSIINGINMKSKTDLNTSIDNTRNSNQSTESLNNTSFIKSTGITSILKKSKNTNKPKKHVSFKPDGIIEQYKIIYLDGRDLYLKNRDINKENSRPISPLTPVTPQEIPLSPSTSNYHFSKLMEIPVLYIEGRRSEEEMEEHEIQKTRKSFEYYMDKEIPFSPRETPPKIKGSNKKISNPNFPQLNNNCKKIPQWSNKYFIIEISGRIKYLSENSISSEIHPNLVELNEMFDLINECNEVTELLKGVKKKAIKKSRKDKFVKLQKFLQQIYTTKIPKNVSPLEYLYERLLRNGFMKKDKSTK